MIGRAASADVERLLTMDPFDRFNRVRVDEWEEWVMDYLAETLTAFRWVRGTIVGRFTKQ